MSFLYTHKLVSSGKSGDVVSDVLSARDRRGGGGVVGEGAYIVGNPGEVGKGRDTNRGAGRANRRGPVRGGGEGEGKGEKGEGGPRERGHRVARGEQQGGRSSKT